METPLIHGNVGKDEAPERILWSMTIALLVCWTVQWETK